MRYGADTKVLQTDKLTDGLIDEGHFTITPFLLRGGEFKMCTYEDRRNIYKECCGDMFVKARSG